MVSNFIRISSVSRNGKVHRINYVSRVRRKIKVGKFSQVSNVSNFIRISSVSMNSKDHRISYASSVSRKIKVGRSSQVSRVSFIRISSVSKNGKIHKISYVSRVVWPEIIVDLVSSMIRQSTVEIIMAHRTYSIVITTL